MSGKKKKTGIMGGTFDPVHKAHLALARQAYEQFSLDEIWMLPNGNPPHKKDSRQADVKHRMKMVELAIREISYLKLCDMERSEKACHYTCETLRQLKERYPDREFYFVMGADSLFEFDSWKNPDIISRECILLAAVRDHCRRDQIQEKIADLKTRYGADIRILNTPNMDIASEDIRKGIRQGENISYMIPHAVLHYIRQHKLYETEDE